MNYEEYAKIIWSIYEETMAKENDDDYELNEIQMQKLIDAYEFFSKIAEESNGRVEDINLSPRETTGHITTYFTLLYFDNEKLKVFSNVVDSMCALSIDATIDGEVCVDFTVPGVFKKKK